MAVTAAQLDVRFTSSGSDRVKSDLKSLDSATQAANSGFQKLQNSILGIGTAFLPVIGAGVRFNVDLEQQMANVNASLGGIDTSKLEELEQGFIDIGSASQFSAVEVAAVGDELAKAGFDPSQIIATTEAVVDLSQATDTDLMTSVSGITAVMSLWKEEIVGTELALTSATEAADIYTAAANASSASVGDIISGVRNFGPTAAGLRISFNETAGAIAFFTTNGLKAADSGVSLTRMIEDLQNPTAEAAALMDEFNITLFDMQGNFVGLPALFDQLNAAFGDMDPKARQAALSVLFGAESLDVATIAAANGGDPLREIIKLTEQHGIAAEQSALRMDTLKSQFGELIESAISLTGKLASGLMPGLRGTVDVANLVVNAMSRIPQPILSAVGAIGALAAAFATLKGAAAGITFLSRLTGMNLPGGALLAGLATPLLAVAAAAGVAYAAFRFNLFGIGDIVRKTARTFVDGFTDMWDSLETVIDGTETVAYRFRGMTFTYTNAAGEVIALTNTVSRVFFALGAGFRAIGWETVADGMDAVARTTETLIQTFRFATNVFTDLLDAGINPVSAALRTLGTVVPAVSEVTTALSGAFTNLLGAWTMLRAGEWSMAFSNLRMAADLAWIAVQEIGSGLGGLVVNLWDWTINTGVPAVTGWIADNAGDIWAGISAAAGWVMDNIIAPIPSITLDVLDWVVTSGVSIWNRIAQWVLGTGAGSSGAGRAAGGGLASAAGTGIPVGPVAIQITEWDVVADAASAYTAIYEWIESTLTVSDADAARWEPKGREIGANIMQGIISGIGSVFGGGGDGSGGGGGGAGGGVFGTVMGVVDGSLVGNFLWSYLQPVFEGAWGELQPHLEQWGTQLKRDVQQWWNGFAPSILQFDTLAGSPVQQGGDAAFGGLANALAGPSFFEKLRTDIEGKWEDFTGWLDGFDFSISIPDIDIDWPDMPEPPGWMTSAPSWWTNMQEGRMPWDDGGSGGGAAGSTGGTSSGDPFNLVQRVEDAFDAIRRVRDMARELGASASPSGGWGGPRSGPLPALGIFAGMIPNADAVGQAARAAFAPIPAAINAALGSIGGTDVTLTVTADTSAAVTSLGETARAMAALNGTSSTVQVLGDNAGAVAAISTAAGALGGINGQSAMTFVNGDPSGAIGAVGSAMGALASVDGFVATAYIEAVNNVGGAVGAAAAALMSIDGMTATTYINVVSTGGAGIGGAIPGRAGGGVVREPLTLVGEFGPELVSLPYGSYVHTAAETRAMMAEGIAPPAERRNLREQSTAQVGGDTYELHIHGNVYGVDELADSLEAAISRRRRGYGQAVAS